MTLIDGSMGTHRDCNLSSYSGEYDLIMCLVLCGAFFFFNYVEDKMEAKLDESIQTAQDYSIMVDDPNGAITDPDDWYQYFSRWGEVKYVSVVRKNSKLCGLLLERHVLTREIEGIFSQEDKEQMVKLAETSAGIVLKEPSLFGTTQKQRYVLKLRNINQQLEAAYKLTYPVIKVFVTFEYEKDQRNCLDALSTSYFDSAIESPPEDEDEDDVEKKYKPRIEDEVLCVREPSEPDNINWQILEISLSERLLKNFISFCIGVVALYGSFYFTNWVQENNPEYFPLAIAAMDTILPSIFQIILLIEKHVDEDDRQNSLLRMLFFARILNPIVMPFLLTPWDDFVKSDTINAILQVQISTCFTSLFVQALDIPGLLDRHINGPLFAKTQTELNSFFAGSPWMLAERYSNVGKILFVSLLYSFITPIALYLAALAFIFIFIVDNYMLFRRWMPAPMLDPSMAKRVRQMGMIALSVHMYVTGRFIYSWPMDNTYFDAGQNGYVRIDARPPMGILDLYAQWWHTDAQSRILPVYKTATIVVFVATLIVCLGETIYDTFLFLFVDSSEEKTSNIIDIPYSALKYVASYCPTINYGCEKYLCTDTSMMKPRHFPPTFSHKNKDQVDLGLQVPPNMRHEVLSVNKYYESKYDEEKKGDVTLDENKEESNASVRMNKPTTVKMDKIMSRLKQEAMYHNTIVQGDEENVVHAASSNLPDAGSDNDQPGELLTGFSIFKKKSKVSRVESHTDLKRQEEEQDQEFINALQSDERAMDTISEANELVTRGRGKIILPPLEVDASSVKRKSDNNNDELILCTADTLSAQEHQILSRWRRVIIRAESTDHPKFGNRSVNRINPAAKVDRRMNRINPTAKVDHSIVRLPTDAIDFEEFMKTTEDIYAGRGLFVSHADRELDNFRGIYDKSTRQGPSRRTLIKLYNKMTRIQKEEWKIVKNMFDNKTVDKDHSLMYGFLTTWITSRNF